MKKTEICLTSRNSVPERRFRRRHQKPTQKSQNRIQQAQKHMEDQPNESEHQAEDL